MNANRMVFFPEYTDHGINHFELVLQTAFDLSTDPAQQLLSPADAAAMCISVALHDFGMHLTVDGFESLIAQGSRWVGVPYFGDKPWSELWEEFFAEASRFDDRKLRSLFGEGYRPVRPLPQKGMPWGDLDYLLVGEFLRRHHPRLAHEIALNGLPAKDGNAIVICPASTEEDRFLGDVCGLIARSHGMELRKCLDYLEYRHSNRVNPRRIHVAFLAVLLRIADYFQIQAQRAPTARTDTSSFQSQISAREWKVHQCVSDIHNTGDDPEAIVVIANPTDVVTYLRLKSWLSGIQEELDRSWAIIGEVYGLQKHNRLDHLGLKIRRVKSNLDDTISFARSVDYVPQKIAFEAANADLLKLLVAPLYNNEPGIGIRELLQNAIDAVRELEDYAAQRPEIASIDRYDQSADVVLRVECDKQGKPITITVTDRGVGMTAQVVQEYFLKAGASFRKSNAWRQDHEDDQGHSKVLRTGRFGVGALAAFLLGDEIEVTTRHIFAAPTDGIKFRARLDDETISLVRAPAPAGTQIRIRVPKRLQDTVEEILPNQWTKDLYFTHPTGHYFLRRPSVKREFSNHQRKFEPTAWLPLPTENESGWWRCFSNEKFEKVFWNYKANSPRLACNGILIEGYKYERPPLGTLFHRPDLSVFDKDGYLPVNLQRTALLGDELPFETDLLRSITDDLIAHALVEAPAKPSRWFDREYEGFRRRTNALGGLDQWSMWLIGKNGFTLNAPHLVHTFDPKTLIVAIGGAPGYASYGELLRKHIKADTLVGSYAPDCLKDTNPRIKGVFRDLLSGFVYLHGMKFGGSLSVIPSTLSKKVRSLRPGKDARQALSWFDKIDDKNGWKVVKNGLPLPEDLEERLTSLPTSELNPIAFCALRLEKWEPRDTNSICSDRWMELLGQPSIPFGSYGRKKLETKSSASIGRVIQLRRQESRKRAKSSDSFPEEEKWADPGKSISDSEEI